MCRGAAVSLIEVLKKGVEDLASDPDSKSWFEGAEDDSIVIRFSGLSPVTFSVRGGRLFMAEGEAKDARSIAEVDPAVFVGFIKGRVNFGGLFVHEMSQYFKAIKGEFYDFGGDFFLLNPITERLAALYRSSPEFRSAVDTIAN